MYQPDPEDIEAFHRAEEARITYHLHEVRQEMNEARERMLEKFADIKEEGRLRKQGVLDHVQYMDRIRQHYDSLTPARRLFRETCEQQSTLRQQAADLEAAIETAMEEAYRVDSPVEDDSLSSRPGRLFHWGLLAAFLGLLLWFLRPRSRT